MVPTPATIRMSPAWPSPMGAHFLTQGDRWVGRNRHVRPLKSFDAILNAVVMELQRTQGAKVKLTLEVEAEAPNGFSDADVSVVRDNARQLKFKPESTSFDDRRPNSMNCEPPESRRR